METRKTKCRYTSKYIVHDGHKFVYFVIQKVACTSVKTTLLSLFDLDEAPYWHTSPSEGPILRVHKLFDASPHQLRKDQLLQGLRGSGYAEYFKFAFVRNPWDRLVSCYSQKVVGGPGVAWIERVNQNLPGQIDKFYRGMPFAEFVEVVSIIPDEEADPHFRSQYVTVCDSEGRIMADFVGRFENLAADFEVVTERIGVAREIQLPHLQRSGIRKPRPYTDFYDERLKNLVHRRYQEDIEVFDYSY